MNSDSKASQSSVLQGPPSGRLNSDQNFDFAADNFGISEVDQNVEHHSFTAERLEEHDLFNSLLVKVKQCQTYVLQLEVFELDGKPSPKPDWKPCPTRKMRRLSLNLILSR